MAAAGYTPILLYASGTASSVPSAGNLTSTPTGAELAINYKDGKLFYKDDAGVVQVIASKAAANPVTTFSAGTTGLTPNTATQGAVTLGGTLATTNGGTGLTAFSANQLFYASSTSAIGQSANMTFNGTNLSLVNDAFIHGLRVGTGVGNQATSTAFGAGASAASDAGGNTAIGASALAANTTSNNTAVGYQSLYSNTTGTPNDAFGYQTLYTNTTGMQNVAIGAQTLTASTTGSYNTGVGYQTLYTTTTGQVNTAVGNWAMHSNTTGQYNTAIGQVALANNQTGSFNAAVGWQALVNTTGDHNTAIGYGSGNAITSGQYNTILGSFPGIQGGLDIRTTDGYVVLSDGYGNPRGYFDNNGNFVAVGNSTNTGNHYLGKSGAAQGVLMFSSDNAAQISMQVFAVSASGFNGAASCANFGYNTGTTRSINAGGTINAAGLDYAEYMVKAGDFTINKGDICGIDANGKLTNIFADAVSFVVKSTNPSYVGGDTWGTGIEDESELEAARQNVDRIAFAGQVPVNVTGATAGQYIVPVANQDGSIGGEAITNPTFEQYQLSVGKVISVIDNVTTIIVKVA